MQRLAIPEEYGMLYVGDAGESRREQHEGAYALLQEVLRARYRMAELPEIARTETGKPYFPEHPEIKFSLSHCKWLAVCLISDRECGVDVEWRRPLRVRVVRKAYAAAEKEALRRAQDPDLLFTRLWTLKEAYVKAIGVGVSYPMNELSFSIIGDSVTSNRTDAAFFHPYFRDYVVSACVLNE